MLRTTGGDYPEFIAAVSILFGLAPDDARAQLELRAESLAAELADDRGAARRATPGLPRLFLLEEEYRRAVLAAELAWLRGVIADLRGGRLTWSEQWLREIAAAFNPPTTTRRNRHDTDDRGPRPRRSATARRRALDGLDLVAEPGQVAAVLGPNGAGKTTFVRAVATLLRPDAGTLRVAGHDVRREPRRGPPRRSAWPASSPPSSRRMTGRENLELVARLFGQDRRTARAQRRGRARAARPDRGRPTGWSAPTRAACGAGSISARAWSARRGCCCSTSPPPASTRAAGSSCGTPSARWSRRAPTCCSTTQYLDEADQLAEPDRDRRPRPRGRAGHAGRAQAPGRRRRDRGARPPRRPARRGRRRARPRSPAASRGSTPATAPGHRRRRRRRRRPRRARSARSRPPASRSTTSRCAGPPSTRSSSPSPASRSTPTQSRAPSAPPPERTIADDHHRPPLDRRGTTGLVAEHADDHPPRRAALPAHAAADRDGHGPDGACSS